VKINFFLLDHVQVQPHTSHLLYVLNQLQETCLTASGFTSRTVVTVDIKVEGIDEELLEASKEVNLCS
jgi:hypothetical protein